MSASLARQYDIGKLYSTQSRCCCWGKKCLARLMVCVDLASGCTKKAQSFLCAFLLVGLVKDDFITFKFSLYLAAFAEFTRQYML